MGPERETVPFNDVVRPPIPITTPKLAEALCKAQAEIEAAPKDSTNPHFKSKYADMASVWSVCRGPLTKNGLSIVQTFEHSEREVTLVTTLLHTSGEWISSRLPIEAPKGSGSQRQGSAITYARRYALAAIVGVVADEDDDGEQAEGRNSKTDGNFDRVFVGQSKNQQLDKANNGAVSGTAAAPGEGTRPQTKPVGTEGRASNAGSGPKPVPNHAEKLGESNKPILPSQLKALAEFGTKQGWTNQDIVDLTGKLLKKDSPRQATQAEYVALRQFISTMTVEQMKKSNFE